MKYLLLAVAVTLTTGCELTRYARIQYEYQVNETELKDLCRGGACNDSSPHVVRGELGYKLKLTDFDLRGGFCHSSKANHGWPFNGKAEYYSDGPCASVEWEF